MYVPFRRLAMPQPRLTVKHRSARLVVGSESLSGRAAPGRAQWNISSRMRICAEIRTIMMYAQVPLGRQSPHGRIPRSGIGKTNLKFGEFDADKGE